MEPLVGRDVPLAAADAAISAAARGSGALVLVSGDAGIGKSRLVQEITQRAVSRGMTRADGFAVDDPGAPPLWPWRRALRDLPDVLAALDDVATDADAGRFAMFVAVTDRLLRAVVTTGIVVVLEDMHWADRLSVLLLNHLCSELPDSRVAVVISFRPRHPGPLRDGLDRLNRGRSVTHVTLDGLASADIRAWLREYHGLQQEEDLADQLRERTAGNPLLIRLLVEAMLSNPAVADGQADGRADARAVDRILAERADLRRLVAARTDALSLPAREILQAASVLGERVTPAVLARGPRRPPRTPDQAVPVTHVTHVTHVTLDGRPPTSGRGCAETRSKLRVVRRSRPRVRSRRCSLHGSPPRGPRRARHCHRRRA